MKKIALFESALSALTVSKYINVGREWCTQWSAFKVDNLKILIKSVSFVLFWSKDKQNYYLVIENMNFIQTIIVISLMISGIFTENTVRQIDVKTSDCK